MFADLALYKAAFIRLKQLNQPPVSEEPDIPDYLFSLDTSKHDSTDVYYIESPTISVHKIAFHILTFMIPHLWQWQSRQTISIRMFSCFPVLQLIVVR